jgi:hypothetical protein
LLSTCCTSATVGQWQGGFFHAVAGVNYPDSDYVPVKLKTSWA